MRAVRGVNSQPRTIEVLNRARPRARARIICFKGTRSRGRDHLRTPVAAGIAIMDHLRGRMSGLGIPTLVIDGPGGAGKIPIGPNYVVSQSPDAWQLRNWQHKPVEYEYVEPKERDCRCTYDDVYFDDHGAATKERARIPALRRERARNRAHDERRRLVAHHRQTTCSRVLRHDLRRILRHSASDLAEDTHTIACGGSVAYHVKSRPLPARKRAQWLRWVTVAVDVTSLPSRSNKSSSATAPDVPQTKTPVPSTQTNGAQRNSSRAIDGPSSVSSSAADESIGQAPLARKRCGQERPRVALHRLFLPARLAREFLRRFEAGGELDA